MIDRSKYISHIDDEEQVINMRRLIDKIEIVSRNHSIESTDFFNPYERRLAKSILNRFNDLSYIELGGLDDSERQIIMMFPDYHYLTDEDLHVRALEVSGYVEEISHRDILGSLMGLGIVREKIGDILIHKDFSQIIVKQEISDYILYNLDKIGRQNILIKKIGLSELFEGKILFEEKINTVASTRLDSIVSMAYNISRSDSQKLISRDRVKVNWEPTDKASVELEEGDLISVKGFGRFILHSINGRSRKNRIRVTVRILK